MSFYKPASYAAEHGSGSETATNSDPKYKFKFYVEFGESSIISDLYNARQYQYLIKSVTKPKPSIDTADSSNQETRTWFGNVPDPTKRNTGTVSWSPITIKFVNFIKRQEKKGAGKTGESYAPPDDEESPTSNSSTSLYSEWDLEHFFSRMVEDMDSSMFGGSAPKPLAWSTDRPENAIARYIETLEEEEDRIAYAKKSLKQKLDEAAKKGYTYVPLNNYSNDGEVASTINKTTNCKSSMDSFMKATCVYLKFFGDIKIYDLINTQPVGKSGNLLAGSEMIANGYWTLRNPWIKSVDFGNHDYTSDELQEYSVEIAYESARYVPMKYN